MIEFIDILLLSPVFICLFWIIQLTSNSGKNDRSKLYMSLFLLSQLLVFLGALFYFGGHVHLWSQYYLMIFFCVYLQYPLLYTYLYYVANNKITISYLIRHFTAPLIILLVLLIMYHLILSPEAYDLLTMDLLQKPLHATKELRTPCLFDMVLRHGFTLQVGLYFFLINKRTNQVKKRIMENYSNTEGISINWIRVFNVMVLFSILWNILFNMKEGSLLFVTSEKLPYPIAILSIFLWYFGSKGDKQKRIVLIDVFDSDNNQSETETFKATYKTIQIQIQKLMEKDCIYTDPNLSLAKLSTELGTNRSYVSKVINNTWKMNFNQFINHYRVKKAKELIISEPDKPLDEIALACGFLSYTSFFRRFKELENISPKNFNSTLRR